jgi:hypothetical protein
MHTCGDLLAGPAFSSGGNASVVFVPDGPEVASLLQRIAMAVMCPEQPFKRLCSPGSITSFACMFGVQRAPAGCEVGGSLGGVVQP